MLQYHQPLPVAARKAAALTKFAAVAAPPSAVAVTQPCRMAVPRASEAAGSVLMAVGSVLLAVG